MTIFSVLLAPCLGALLAANGAPGSAVAAAPPAQLTLEEAIAAARARSPRLEAAAALAEGARAASRLAGRWPNPTVELNTENLTRGGWHWTPPADPTVAPGLDAFALLTQSVELGGKRGARRALAGAEAGAADASLARTERALVLDTVRTYLDALRARETLAALNSHREAFDVLQQAMASRVREGVVAESDLAKFQAEAGRLRAQEARTSIELDRSLALLAAIIGEASPVAAERLMEPAAGPLRAGPADALATGSLERSPEVRVARALEARSASALALERARRIPDLAVSGGYKRTAGFDTAVLGVSMAIPLFDRNGPAVAMATGEARSAAAERAAVEARVVAEVRASLQAARLLQERARLAEEEVLKPAEVVRNAARAAFREGASNILNVVDSERVYLEARREVLQVRLDALAAGIETRLLLGEEILR